MKRVLITGAAGFLGSHLVDALLAQGMQVVGVDNFYTGRRENLAHLKGNSNFVLIEHDVRQGLAPHDSRTVAGTEVVYHLACPASPPVYQRDPQYTVETAVLGTRTMLEFAREQHARFVQASSSEVYGSPTEHPQCETYWGFVNPIGPRAVYDEGKRVGETWVTVYARQHHVDARIARIFNTYGPRMRMDDGRVVTNFIAQALAGKPLTVYGDGSQTRSFCYVADLIEGLVQLGLRDKLPFGPINLGNPHEVTITKMAQLILKLTKSTSQIDKAPLPQDDPPRRQPDISRAKELLAWTPQTSLEDGLRATLAGLPHAT